MGAVPRTRGVPRTVGYTSVRSSAWRDLGSAHRSTMVLVNSAESVEPRLWQMPLEEFGELVQVHHPQDICEHTRCCTYGEFEQLRGGESELGMVDVMSLELCLNGSEPLIELSFVTGKPSIGVDGDCGGPAKIPRQDLELPREQDSEQIHPRCWERLLRSQGDRSSKHSIDSRERHHRP